MVYNKTKRGLEMASGIVGVVISSLEVLILACYIIPSLAVLPSDYYYYIGGYIVGYLIIAVFAVLNLVFSALVIKSPVQPDGIVKQRNGIRICMLVFSILDGQWVTAGLMIAVLCLKDLRPANPAPSQMTQTQASMQTQAPQTLDAKIVELKHLKEIGVIDEESYKKAINKLMKDVL